MNKKFFKLLILLVAPLLVFTGCEDDEVVGEPQIVLATTRASMATIDLDAGTGPNLRGWAVAPAGLGSVTITAVRSGSTETLLNVTSFNVENSELDGTRYNFNVYPEYTPELSSITLTVTDTRGDSRELVFEIGATNGTAGPTMTGFTDQPIEANVRQNVNIRPAIAGTISSHWGLESVTIYETYNGAEETAETITDFGDTPNSYELNYTPDYDRGLAQGLTALRIRAVDGRGNVRERVFQISVIDAQPRPVITFSQQSIEADLTVSPNVEPAISGSVESFEELSSVNIYIIQGVQDQLIQEQTAFQEPNNFTFTIQPEYGLGVNGLKVVAVDAAGQTTTKTIDIQVNAEDPDLLVWSGVISNAQANRNDAGVVRSISAREGVAYTLADGLDPAVSDKIDFITVDSGGDDNLDLFSPSHTGWLENNYFKKDVMGDMAWPVRNQTKMRALAPSEVNFARATSKDIEALEVGDDFKLRIESEKVEGGVGNLVILFETSRGKKGLILWKGHNPNAAEGSKADIFTFDIKVLK